MVRETIENLLELGGPWTFKPLFDLIANSEHNNNYCPYSLEKYLKLTAESDDEQTLLSVFSIKPYHSAIISLQFKALRKLDDMLSTCFTRNSFDNLFTLILNNLN